MRLHGSLLAADPAARTIVGRLLPWNTPGRTSRGEVTFRPGTLSVPADLGTVTLNTDHDQLAPIGHLTAAHDDGVGLVATFAVDAGPRGDQALLDAQNGLRAGLSVECADVSISDRAVNGARLIGAGLVNRAAFPGAQVVELTAAEADAAFPSPPPPVPVAPAYPAPYPVAVPLPLAAAAPSPALTAGGRERGMADLYAALVGTHTGRLSPELTAALTDITHTDNAWAQPTQYAAELWSGISYERAIVPLVSRETLTSYNVTGWRWKVAPEVDTWLGDKTDVPSNAPETEAVNTTADRLAGAHDIDRKFRDFSDTEFFRSYYAAMADSYARKSDTALLTDLLAAATAGTAAGAGATAFDQLVSLYLQGFVYGARPSIVVGSGVLAALYGLNAGNAPAMLDGLPYNPLTLIVPSPLVPANQMLLIQRQAAAFYELPGSPIRVEAVDMVKGGIDAGVFGYFATIVRQPKAILKATYAAPLPLGAPAATSTGK